MKKLLLATALVFVSSVAFAGGPSGVECNGKGKDDEFKCQTDSGQVFNVSNVNSAEAAAEAVAAAIANSTASATGGNASATGGDANAVGLGGAGGQGGRGGDGGNANQGQSQGQGQNQVAKGGNAYNAGNSVNIEGDPAHTTSFNVGVGVGVTARLGEGVRARAVTDAADWLKANGQSCLALEAMLELHPDLKKMNKTVNCK